MTNNIEEFKKKHMENYKRALVDTIINNTNALFDEDIASLLKIPPLDSMDIIKSRLLDLAKKNKIVLDNLKLNEMINTYHSQCLIVCDELKEKRINLLSNIVNEFKLVNQNDIVKLVKKDFIYLNKEIKNILKLHVKEVLDNIIFNNIDSLFDKNVNLLIKKRIVVDVTKYINNTYLKQLLENIDFKILVKDTILINSIKEQGDRYLFTIENSRLFNVE